MSLYVKAWVCSQTGFQKLFRNKTYNGIFQRCRRNRIISFISKAPVTDDIARSGKTNDQFFWMRPLFMNFDPTAIHKINTFNRITFVKNGLSFFNHSGFFIMAYQRPPFYHAMLTQKTIIQVTGCFGHIQNYCLYHIIYLIN